MAVSDDDDFEDWVHDHGQFRSNNLDVESEGSVEAVKKKRVKNPRKVITRGVFVKNF